jgi:hypothetical protein
MRRRKLTTSTQTRLGLLMLTRLCLPDMQMRRVAMMAAVADVKRMGTRRQKMAKFYNQADARKMKVAGPGAHRNLHAKMTARNKAEIRLKSKVKKM